MTEAVVDAKRERIYWCCQIIGWFTYESFWLMPQLFSDGGRDVATRLLVANTMTGALLLLAVTHVFRRVIQRRAWAALSPPRLLPRAIAGCIAAGVANTLLWTPIDVVENGGPGALRSWLPWSLATSTFAVLLWSTVYFGVHYFERWRQADRDRLALAVTAAEVKLDSLRSQVNPHFLFNCLNSVRALTIEDPPRAHIAVTALARLIRYSLQATQAPMVALETELDIVRAYLMLEGIRFEERLRYTFEIAPDSRSVAVPPMLVQSLVENGVKHGIERLPAGGTIEIAAGVEAGALHVRVSNSGRIVTRDGSTLLGLRNARERLRLLYGPGASLAIREEAGQVIAELAVPLTRAVT